MKSILPFLLTLLIVGIALLANCSSQKRIANIANNGPEIVLVPEEYPQTVLPEEVIEVSLRPSREVMVKEVVDLWTMWLNDYSTRKKDPRWSYLNEYAEALVDAVIFYQDNPTSRGGQLPVERETHLLVASMVVIETGITHTVVGTSRGEVGLLQCHGHALQGFEPETVSNNYRLGLRLGVRWLAYHTQFCQYSENRTFQEWVKPLSLYAAGIKNGKRKDGRCRKMAVAKDRVNMTLFYANRILNS